MKNILLLIGLTLALNVSAQVATDEMNEQPVVSASIAEPMYAEAQMVTSENPDIALACERCETENCITVKRWWDDGVFYTQVTNNTDQMITYKVCVLTKTGYWTCGTDQVRPNSTDDKASYYSADPSGGLTIYAAYGDWASQECSFPNPN